MKAPSTVQVQPVVSGEVDSCLSFHSKSWEAITGIPCLPEFRAPRWCPNTVPYGSHQPQVAIED